MILACGATVIEEIKQLIEKYNTKADRLNGSMNTVKTSELYADHREEWLWYLKGQQQSLKDAAIDLQVLLLKKQIESGQCCVFNM